MGDSCITIHNLNDDCLLHIFKLISIQDRNDLEFVCRRWRRICSLLWKMTHVFDVTEKQLGFTYKFHDRITQGTINPKICERIFLKCFSYLKEVNLSRNAVNFQGAKFIDSGHSCDIDLTAPRRPNKLLNTLNSLKNPLSHCKHLEKLSMCFCVLDVDNEFLIHLFKMNQKLRYILLSKYQLTGECLSHLPLGTLESIELYRCLVDNEDKTCFVSNAPRLQTLSVVDRSSRCNFARKILPISSPSLSRLNLVDNKITQQLTSDICNCKHLTFLSLREAHLDDYTLMLIMDSCKNLVVLDISNIESLTDVILRKTRTLQHLKFLDIGFNWNFTDAGLLTLSDDLRMLDLSVTNFSCNAILTILKRNESLEVLGVAFYHLDLIFLKLATEVIRLRPNNVPLEIVHFDSSSDIDIAQYTCPQVKFSEKSVRLRFSKYEEYNHVPLRT